MIEMGARWYDARIGRWIQPDTIVPNPANPQSLNRFSYVLGNPLRYRDPSGHQSEWPPRSPAFVRTLGLVGFEGTWTLGYRWEVNTSAWLVAARFTQVVEADQARVWAGGLQIAGGGLRTEYGYRPGEPPFLRRPYQQHLLADDLPIRVSGEDFADMFLNWTHNTFADDPDGYGEARYTWMNSRMPGWLALAINGNQ